MAITDYENVFSTSQAVVATAESEYNIKAASVGCDVGVKGQELRIYCNVQQAFNNLTTLTIALQTDDSSAFGSAVTLWSRDFALAALTLNAKLNLPTMIPDCKTYLRLYYTITGDGPSTGILDAGVVMNKSNLHYPSDARKNYL